MGGRAASARLLLVGLVVGLGGADLVLKAAAHRTLGGGRVVDLGLLDLRLGFNSGTAFGLGAELPATLILVIVGLITAGVAVFAWHEAAKGVSVMALGLAAIVAGAGANLVDRAGDGVVTDYLHSGWWPTFNLADVFITLGALAVLVAAWRSPSAKASAADKGDQQPR